MAPRHPRRWAAGNISLFEAQPRIKLDRRRRVDVLSISRRLGHGSPAITLGVYGHLFKPDDRAAAAIDELLGGK